MAVVELPQAIKLVSSKCMGWNPFISPIQAMFRKFITTQALLGAPFMPIQNT